MWHHQRGDWDPAGNDLVADLAIQQASNHWITAALSYVGFCMLWLAAFLTALGKTVPTQREARWWLDWRCRLCAIVHHRWPGLLANIERVAGMQIPMLVLASDIAPLVASFDLPNDSCRIYTTAIPSLDRVVTLLPDGTKKYKYLTIFLALLGTVIGLWLPFDEMVNIVYVLNGYVGAVLLAIMVVVTIWKWAARRRTIAYETPADLPL